MIVTVASHKGGAGKTTTAVHVAAYLQTQAPTLLLDRHETRNATGAEGTGLTAAVGSPAAADRTGGREPGHELQPSAPEARPISVGRGRGRPPGKRSDPAYEPTTVLLRKQTKRAAHRKLEDAGEKADLSMLIERLLCQWNENS